MVRLRIDPLFWVLALAIGWLNSQSLLGTFLWGLVILISVLVHELGHACTAVFFGQKATITLMIMGGVTEREGGKLKPWQDFLIILNGPLAGFLTFLLCASLRDSALVASSGLLLYLTSVGSYVNFFWTLVNLAPIYPLDGGQLLFVALKSFFGVKGVKVTFFTSALVALGLAVFFFFLHAFLAGAIFLLFAFEAYREFLSSRFFTPSDDRKDIKENLSSAIHAFQEGRYQEAESQFIELLAAVDKGMTHLQATVYLARLLAMKHDTEGAYELLHPQSEKLELEDLKLLQRLSFDLKKFEEASQIGNRVHPESADKEVAFINAICQAELHQVESAIGWFETAVRDGLEDPQSALLNPGFDPIRQEEAFIRYSLKIDT